MHSFSLLPPEWWIKALNFWFLRFISYTFLSHGNLCFQVFTSQQTAYAAPPKYKWYSLDLKPCPFPAFCWSPTATLALLVIYKGLSSIFGLWKAPILSLGYRGNWSWFCSWHALFCMLREFWELIHGESSFPFCLSLTLTPSLGALESEN